MMPTMKKMLELNARWRDNMTDEEIDKYFMEYCEALENLSLLTGDEL